MYTKDFKQKKNDDLFIDDDDMFIDEIDLFVDDESPEPNDEESLAWPNRKRRIIVDENDTEAVFYFLPAEYEMAEAEKLMQRVVNSMAWNGRCTGVDLNRFWRGEISVYFNPVYQTSKAKSVAIAQMINGIRNMPRR